VPQHLATATHQKKVKEKPKDDARASQVQQSVVALQKRQEELNLAGKTVSPECKTYRIEALRKCYQANMSIGILEKFQPLVDQHSRPGLSIGFAKDLARTIGPVLLIDEMKQLRDKMQGCYPEFATISDGTPAGAEIEAIKVQMVQRHDYQIIEVLVKIKLYARKLKGGNIAHNLLYVLKRDCGLDPADWRAAMLDRASTNSKALNDIRATTKYRPVNFPCFSHTLCKPGEAFKAPEAEVVRKAYNKAVLFRGKAADLMKDHFKETVKIAAHVRWWVQYEQTEQVDRFGIAEIMKEVIPTCVEKKYSERSVAKLQQHATDLSTPGIMVEFAAIAETGRPFCQATYILEGDDPLVLTAYIVLDKLDQVIADGVKFERTKLVCKEAASMVLSLRKPLLDDIQSRKDSMTNIERTIEQLLANSDTEDGQVDGAKQPAKATATTASQKTSSRKKKATPKAQAATQQQKKAQAAGQKRREDSQSKPSALATARDKLKTTSDNLKNKQEELEHLDKKLVQITEKDFLKHAGEVVEPAFKKVQKSATGGERATSETPRFDAYKTGILSL
jgi:hypothetical protein